MGELPTTDHSKPGWARWAIPLTLAAVVAAAAVYEWMRPPGVLQPTAARDTAVIASPVAIPASPDTSGTPLPNPFGAAKATAESPPAPDPAQASLPAPVQTSTATAPTSEQPLILAFRDYSWTVVRDRDGRLLLSRMNPGGTAQNLSGMPPFDIVIGNAVDVRLTYKGDPVDLVPHTRQNVARFKLQ
jgi:cytoskeleton protein RodZ